MIMKLISFIINKYAFAFSFKYIHNTFCDNEFILFQKHRLNTLFNRRHAI